MEIAVGGAAAVPESLVRWCGGFDVALVRVLLDEDREKLALPCVECERCDMSEVVRCRWRIEYDFLA